jgi:hypothetical protein
MNEIKECKRGWYEYLEGYFPTHEALQKEIRAKFGLNKRELAMVLFSTKYGYPHYGELRLKSRMNAHNNKPFCVYCLLNVERLIKKEVIFEDFRLVL